MNSSTDLVILGGGLAGLTLALQCREKLPTASITVLEKRQHPVPEAAHKVGESSVEAGAHYFGTVLGLREHIVERQLPKLGLRFFFPAGDNSRIEDRLELGGKRYAPCPSYQIDRGRFENFLGDRCREQGIDFLDQATVKTIEIGRRGQPHRVAYDRDGEKQLECARWVVDASGRMALLKRQLGLGKPSPHLASAAWFRFGRRIRIDDWCGEESWNRGHSGQTARWYSTNHLMGRGYWVWLIPLSSGSTSLGIVASEEFHRLSDFNSPEKAVAWLERHEPQCAAAVKRSLNDVQDFRAIKHYATECRQVFSARRWGITGEAGFFHDPFYSPGSDFIAFANTFLADLIHRDLTGRDFRIRAFSYDRIFKRFYYGTAVAYQNQYRIFGNPTVMPVKIMWDYLVYWSITAFLFMQSRMCRQTMYLRNISRLSRLSRANEYMQDFFRKWHEVTDGREAAGSIDTGDIPLIREANERLSMAMNDRTFFRQFEANVRQLETLACEITEASGLSVSPPFRKPVGKGIRAGAFAAVFAPRNRTVDSIACERRETADTTVSDYSNSQDT